MRTMSRKLVALTAVLGVGLAACQGTSTAPPESNQQELATVADLNLQPRENLQDGGELVETIGELPSQLNVFHSDGANGNVGALALWYLPQLGVRSPEGEWSPDPDYLTDVADELVDGKRVVTYTVNPDAVFNDGTPIDVRAFQALWKATNGSDEAYSPFNTTGYSLIDSIEAGADDKEVVVTFRNGYPWWDDLFGTLMHPDVDDAETFNTAYLDDPHDEWGAGPYHITDFDAQAGTVVFERNPSWWGEPGKLDKRIVRVLEAQAAINAFRNGEVDVAQVANQENLSQIQGMSGIDVRTAAQINVNFVTFNAGSPKLEQPQVREALMRAIDRRVIFDISTQGLNYTEDQLPGSMLFQPYNTYYSDNLAKAGIAYDTAAATTLLDEAGWTPGADGIRVKDGERLSLVWPIIGDNASRANMARAVQAMYKEIGVELTLDTRASTEFTDTLYENKYDVMTLAWGDNSPSYGVTGSFCQLYCEEAIFSNGLPTAKDYNAAYAELVDLPEEQAQIDRANELELKAMSEEFTMLPLYNGPRMIAVPEKLANYGSGMFYDIQPEDIGYTP